MKKCPLVIAFAVMVFASAMDHPAAARPLVSETYTVTRVVDGDTVVLNDGQKVRLVGVDTPEFHYSKKLEKDAVRSHRDMATIQALGKRASEFTKTLLLSKKVALEYDRQHNDRYGRTLAYIILPDGTNVNKEIVKQGYGVAYTKYPFKYMEEFRAAEREAREKKRGLWADGGGL